ncbi:hypothetical protein Hanom_Chr07g00590301 [Helianthus anomalus]
MLVRLCEGVVEHVGYFLVCEKGNSISPEVSLILMKMATSLETHCVSYINLCALALK